MRIKDGDVGAREEFIKGKLRLLRKMSEMTRKQEVLHDRIKFNDDGTDEKKDKIPLQMREK